jgi:hypothetical protein
VVVDTYTFYIIEAGCLIFTPHQGQQKVLVIPRGVADDVAGHLILNLALYSSLILSMPISDPDTIALVSVSSSVPNPKMEYLIA